jgi:hypothetical protein
LGLACIIKVYFAVLFHKEIGAFVGRDADIEPLFAAMVFDDKYRAQNEKDDANDGQIHIYCAGVIFYPHAKALA